MTKSRPKRSGQGKTDSFRERVGTKNLAEMREAETRHFGIFDNTTDEIEKLLKNLAITVQRVAVPLLVATRGIGFSSVV